MTVDAKVVAEAVQKAKEAIQGKPPEVQRKVLNVLMATNTAWQQPEVSAALLALVQPEAKG